MTITKIDIINRALVGIGAGVVFSIDDDSDLSAQISLAWDQLVDFAFGMHDWTFCRKTFKLTRHAETPENGWQYGFDLPGNKIGDPLKLMAAAGQSPAPLRNFDLEGFSVYTCEPNVWARCRVFVDPDYWDPAFRASFVRALEGEFCIPVFQDEKLRDQKLTEAFGTPSREMTGGMFGRLIAQNRGSAPVGSPLLDDDPLTAVRSSGGPLSGPWHGSF